MDLSIKANKLLSELSEWTFCETNDENLFNCSEQILIEKIFKFVFTQSRL